MKVETRLREFDKTPPTGTNSEVSYAGRKWTRFERFQAGCNAISGSIACAGIIVTALTGIIMKVMTIEPANHFNFLRDVFERNGADLENCFANKDIDSCIAFTWPGLMFGAAGGIAWFLTSATSQLGRMRQAEERRPLLA